MYISIYIYMCVCVYAFIYTERYREIKRNIDR